MDTESDMRTKTETEMKMRQRKRERLRWREKKDGDGNPHPIFPKKQGRKREISNESARGWSLREVNV